MDRQCKNTEEPNLQENHKNSVPFAGTGTHKLWSDCSKCFGLCCVALYFAASEGFPVDKEAGQPCPNLQSDFRCRVHKDLCKMGLKGCSAFDCFGAGGKVSQVTFKGRNWRQVPESSMQMFQVFLIMRLLHELLWYLTNALAAQPATSLSCELSAMYDKLEKLTFLDAEALLKLDVAAQREEVNVLLVKTSELVRAEIRCGHKADSEKKRVSARRKDFVAADLRRTDLTGANLRGALLIAADLRGADMTGADLIGADFRDADVRGTDFTGSIFLTQAQVNVANGDASTKLPPWLDYPDCWVTTK